MYYRAADYLVRTGPVVTLEVAKQGAIYHGLATLLQQPSPITHRGEFEKELIFTRHNFVTYCYLNVCSF